MTAQDTHSQLSEQEKQTLRASGIYEGRDGGYYQSAPNPNSLRAIKHSTKEDAENNNRQTAIYPTIREAYDQLPDHLRQQTARKTAIEQDNRDTAGGPAETETSTPNRPPILDMTDEELADLPDFDTDKQETGGEEAETRTEEAETGEEKRESNQQPGGSDSRKPGPDYASMLAAARVRPTDKIPTPPICLTIEQDGGETVIGTLGNISAIIGKPKSKKTFAATFAIAAAAACKLMLNRVKGSLPDTQKTVLLFDTEQSKFHVLRVVKRICALVGVEEPPNLIVYSLREYSPNERLALIDHALNHTNGLGLAVIDGIRDLQVDPILDAEQASKIITHLLRWTTELNIHIMTVLHQNKSDGNARGHLGTELTNKAETVISVTKDRDNKEVSIMAPEFCRGRDFEQFPFSVDDDGLPFLVEDWLPKTAGSKRTETGDGQTGKLSVTSRFTHEIHKAIVRRMFAGVAPAKYAITWQRLKRATEHFGDALADNPAKELLGYYQDAGHIQQDSKKCYILSLPPDETTPDPQYLP